MTLKAFLSTILLAMVAQSVSAIPLAEQAYPEFTPGVGLPSLAELNLTVADLYNKPLPLAARANFPRSADYTPACGPSNAYTDVNDIISCYHYLDAAGTAKCSATNNKPVTFCKINAGEVAGQALQGSASSYCRDVASAVLYTINHCTRNNQGNTVAGSQAANGNGNLIIESAAVSFLG